VEALQVDLEELIVARGGQIDDARAMKAHQRSIGQSDEWLTPRWILDPLGAFDLDPCASIVRPWATAARHFTVEDDGLRQPWYGRVWCNPPFNRHQRPEWMRRMAEHGNGIMLIPAACETVAFSAHVWGKASALLMLNRRPHFCDTDGSEAPGNSGCTICLVAYGRENALALLNSGLGVVLREAV